MATPLTTKVTSADDGTVVVAVAGEIDMSNVDVFTQALTDAVGSAKVSQPVTVDLTAVEYLDSGAINALFARANHIRITANSILVPVLTISGLTELVTVESATASPSE